MFNMGIGMAVIVSPETLDIVHNFLWEYKETCYLIGEIVEGEKGVEFIKKP